MDETMDGEGGQRNGLPCMSSPRLDSSLDQQCLFRCQDFQVCLKAAERVFRLPALTGDEAVTVLKSRLDQLLLRLQIWKSECVDNNAFLPKITNSLDPSLYLSMSTAFKSLRTDMEDIWTNIESIYSLTEQGNDELWGQQEKPADINVATSSISAACERVQQRLEMLSDLDNSLYISQAIHDSQGPLSDLYHRIQMVKETISEVPDALQESPSHELTINALQEINQKFAEIPLLGRRARDLLNEGICPKCLQEFSSYAIQHHYGTCSAPTGSLGSEDSDESRSVTSLADDDDGKEDPIALIKMELMEKEKIIASIQRQLKEKDATIASMQKQLKEKEKTISDLDAQNTTQRGSKDKDAGLIDKGGKAQLTDEERDRLSDLRKQIGELTKKVETFKEENTRPAVEGRDRILDRKIEELTKKLEALSKETKSRMRENDPLRSDDDDSDSLYGRSPRGGSPRRRSSKVRFSPYMSERDRARRATTGMDDPDIIIEARDDYARPQTHHARSPNVPQYARSPEAYRPAYVYDHPGLSDRPIYHERVVEQGVLNLDTGARADRLDPREIAGLRGYLKGQGII